MNRWQGNRFRASSVDRPLALIRPTISAGHYCTCMAITACNTEGQKHACGRANCPLICRISASEMAYSALSLYFYCILIWLHTNCFHNNPDIIKVVHIQNSTYKNRSFCNDCICDVTKAAHLMYHCNTEYSILHICTFLLLRTLEGSISREKQPIFVISQRPTHGHLSRYSHWDYEERFSMNYFRNGPKKKGQLQISALGSDQQIKHFGALRGSFLRLYSTEWETYSLA